MNRSESLSNQHSALKQRPTWRKLLLLLVVLCSAFAWWRWQYAAPAPLAPSYFVQTINKPNFMSFSSDGKTLTVKGGGYVSELETLTGRILQVKRHIDSVYETSVVPDTGRDLRRTDNAPEDNYVELYDTATGDTLRKYKIAATERIALVWPDASRFLLGDDKRDSSRLIETATGRTIATVPYLSQYLSTWLVNNNRWILSGGYDYPTHLLNADTLRPVYPKLELLPLRHVKLSRDSSRLFGADKNGDLHIWHLLTGQHKVIQTGLSNAYWVFETEDKNLIVQGRRQRKINYLGYVEYLQVRSGDGLQLQREIHGNIDLISRNGRFAMFGIKGEVTNSGENPSEYCDVYDTRIGKILARCDLRFDPLGQPRPAIPMSTERFAISPDGRSLVHSDKYGLLSFFNLKQGAVLPKTPLALTAEGKLADVQGRNLFNHSKFGRGNKGIGTLHPDNADARIQTIDGKKFRLLDLPPMPSPDAKRKVLLWVGLRYNPNTKINKPKYETKSEVLIEIRDMASNRVLRTISCQDYGSITVYPIWSLNGDFITAGEETGKVRLWNTHTGDLAGQFSGTRAIHWKRGDISSAPPNQVDTAFLFTPLAFSPDSRYLAVGRNDGSIYLYSLKTWLPVAQVGKAASPLSWITFAPDGKKIYGISHNAGERLVPGLGMATDEKAMRMWDMPPLPVS